MPDRDDPGLRAKIPLDGGRGADWSVLRSGGTLTWRRGSEPRQLMPRGVEFAKLLGFRAEDLGEAAVLAAVWRWESEIIAVLPHSRVNMRRWEQTLTALLDAVEGGAVELYPRGAKWGDGSQEEPIPVSRKRMVAAIAEAVRETRPGRGTLASSVKARAR